MKIIYRTFFIITISVIIMNFKCFALNTNNKNQSFNKSQDNIIENNLEAMILYKKLLNGEITVSDNYKTMDIKKLISSEENMNRYEAEYTYCDINKDNIKELLIKSKSYYQIITYRDKKLCIIKDLSCYQSLLNNGAFLLTREGAAPYHIDYAYTIMGYNDEAFYLCFSKYDTNEDNIYDDKDVYIYDNIEVSKDIWHKLTDKYFEIGSDEIIWNTLEIK